MTDIRPCNCKHDYQDSKYGPGKRVFNMAKPKEGAGIMWRCTVCGAEQGSPTPHKVEE